MGSPSVGTRLLPYRTHLCQQWQAVVLPCLVQFYAVFYSCFLGTPWQVYLNLVRLRTAPSARLFLIIDSDDIVASIS